MPKKSSKTNLRSSSRFSLRQVIVFCLIFGLIGGIVGWAAFAAPAPLGSGSIGIATLNGQTYSSSMTPTYGQTVTFNTVVPKMAGWQYPMIALSCYQDVNGDGTINTALLGPDIVYSQLDKPTATFGFNAQGWTSIWSYRGGGAAKCRADLDAYGWKSGRESVQVLGTTGDFDVAG